MENEGWNNPSWEGKTEWPIGLPVDPLDAPTLLYQALLGRVYTRLSYRDGTVSRGQIEPAVLEALVGGGLKEGWYSASGDYLGATVPGDDSLV